MKYAQDRNASGKTLRLLVQKMAGHPAAISPLSYTVWYEFVTGSNPELSAAMDALLASGGKVDDEAIETLYLKHVCECNVDVERTMREEVQQVLAQLAEVHEETGEQAHRFGGSLHAYGATLKQNLDAPRLIALASSMSVDTARMRDSMQHLQSELASSRDQVEKLHWELQSARGEALNDPLTGIFNRRGFEARARKMFAAQEASGESACLLMLDIDHFKKINDTYGHLFGDKVLRGIAETLKSKVRGQDLIARLGGEEFAVLLAKTDLSGAWIVAEQIRQTVQQCKIHRLDTQEKIGGITISIGVAAYASGLSLPELLNQADKALYSSKEQGRNRTTLSAENRDACHPLRLD